MTLQPTLSVGRSVGPSHFTFFYDFISLTSLLLPKWSSDLKYGPCPPARNFGSRVSGLVLISLGQSMNETADAVVERVLQKHPSTSVSKMERRLREDGKDIYTEAK